ncbi:Uxx-star family glutaredoxin-like (seleno)protein [Methanoregula sp.]|uniref:Uxx-star family glutaredoxin-like (seleno)protein n=1 Tax=Methanoregula sp. TaxID=2052170 RepID=UPI002B5B6421|nr:Uxx-star family glutaredoxin-like (seleno)protein [Methanoregula sp.]HVP96403.1 Uxx-star family glutaredoxin-like (seleno)protein [Methanoregula sp.]
MSTVTVYSTKNCPYCRMAKAFLDKQGIQYTAIDVGADAAAAEKMIALSGQRGVPVITVDDEVIIGFDSQRLNELFGTHPSSEIYDVVIVGAGPAGLTAGVYCARKLLKTLIVSESIGGQALESWAIENYMGYRMITGEDLMKKFEEQVRTLDVRLELDRVTGIVPDENLFAVTTISGITVKAKSLILTPGKQPRKLGVQDEEKYLGRGLSICSTCDGPLYKGKKVAVVGGGNSALQTAVEMSGIASSVSLIVRSTIKADPVYVKKLEGIKNITVHLHAHITGLAGEPFLQKITIATEGQDEQHIDIDGVFIEVGWTPNTDNLKDLVTLNEKKEIVVDVDGRTSRPGIFAAGDVTSVKSKQIIIAAGDGAKAALEAYEYLMSQG